MSDFFDNIKKVLLKKKTILISNVGSVDNDEYVLDLFLRNHDKVINFTFSKYLAKYGDASDLYDIYDHCDFNSLNDFILYFDEKYKKDEVFLNEILKNEYSRYLK